MEIGLSEESIKVKAFKVITKRLSAMDYILNGWGNENIHLIDLEQSLEETLNDINNVVNSNELSVSDLKKKIKYSKNIMEKKVLEKQLNTLYKNNKSCDK